MKFKWGGHDCVTFAIQCLSAQFEGDVARGCESRFGTWSSEAEARTAHGNRLGDCVTEVLGRPVKWVFLSMGDIGLATDDDGREFVCVNDGAGFVAPAAKGLFRVPYHTLVCGWRAICPKLQ